MRHLFRLGLIILLTLGAAAGSAPLAAAGGPTSLLIVNPATQRTSSAYHGDGRYERLAGLVGLNSAAGINQTPPGESPPAGIDSSFGTETRLTWLIHDMSVWRVDRVHLVGEAVWINTMTMIDREANDPGEGVWHRAADPKQLRAALTETGVLRNPPPGSAEESAGPATPDPAASDRPADQAAVISGGAPPAGLIGLGCGLLGIALGVGATLLTLHSRRGRPDRIVLSG